MPESITSPTEGQLGRHIFTGSEWTTIWSTMNDNRQLHILRWPVMMPIILWNFRHRCLSLVALMVRPNWPARSSVNSKGSSFVISISFVIISKRCNIGDIYIIQIRSRNPGVTAQINPPLKYTRVYSGLYLGIIWNIPWELPDYTPGIFWELPEYTPHAQTIPHQIQSGV